MKPAPTDHVDCERVRPLYSAEEIAEPRGEAGATRSRRARPSRLLVVIVLKGGFVFGADLVRALAPQRRAAGDRVHLACKLRLAAGDLRRGAGAARHRGRRLRPRRAHRRRRARFGPDAEIRPRAHAVARRQPGRPSPSWSTSRRAAAPGSRPITLDLPVRIILLWVTAWMPPMLGASSPMWGCSNPPQTTPGKRRGHAYPPDGR